jgi:hypothetical protein
MGEVLLIHESDPRVPGGCLGCVGRSLGRGTVCAFDFSRLMHGVVLAVDVGLRS